jgi:hypothetical protein
MFALLGSVPRHKHSEPWRRDLFEWTDKLRAGLVE